MLRILTILFALLLVFLIGRLWIGNGSFPQIWHMKDQIKTLSSSNQTREEENRKLEAEIQQFKEGTEAIEDRARSDFGMIKKGETFYQVILEDRQLDSASGQPEGSPRGTSPATAEPVTE